MQTAKQNIDNAKSGTKDQVLQTIMNEAERLTASPLSYFATMNDDEDVLTMIGWSNKAMENCKMITQPIVYQLDNTGLWGDAVRERKPSITNNYATVSKPTKKGYPEGHVEVVHHMNIPVFEDGKIVGVLGVGNKSAGYTNADADTLTQFMSHAWPVLDSKL